MTEGYTPSDISALCGAAINSLLAEKKLTLQKEKKKERDNSMKSDLNDSSKNSPKMSRISSRQLGLEVITFILFSVSLFQHFCSTYISFYISFLFLSEFYYFFLPILVFHLLLFLFLLYFLLFLLFLHFLLTLIFLNFFFHPNNRTSELRCCLCSPPPGRHLLSEHSPTIETDSFLEFPWISMHTL